ncbi:MAG TPA: proprotein convertase P-domain-containing protein [Saprospiraceae bacterium]|nr:proprotein convertase P-domain-containing protein [Saprospiraceae bacterium]
MAIILRTKALLVLAGMCCTLATTAQNYLITQPNIQACSGFFLDSGGNSGGYGANENFTATICPAGGQGTHAQLIFSRVEINDGDSLCFFDGNSVNAPFLSCIDDFRYQGPFIIRATAANPSGCITVRFRSGQLSVGGGWSADISCTQACQTIEPVLVSANPLVSPVDTGWMDVCPGQRIFLTARGNYPQNGTLYQHSDLNSTFRWEFGDGSRAVGPNVSHVFRESGGYVVRLTIQDSRGCTNTQFLNQRVRVSAPPVFLIGDNLPGEICAGDTVALNATINRLDPAFAVSTIPRELSFQTGAVRSDSLALPDGTGASYRTSVTFSNFSPGQVLTRMEDLESICVNIEHSWMRDLEIELICPNGQRITLHEFGGRSGGEVYLGEPVDFDGTNPTPGKGYDYCWVDNAQRTWLEYANQFRPRTLPAGDYRPYQSFSNLVGCPLNGEWTIRVQDLWAIDNGFIFSWGVNFNANLFPELEKFTPGLVRASWQQAPSIFSFSSNDIQATPQNAGSAAYRFLVTDSFGCNYDTVVNVNVLPLTHPNCRDCSTLLTPVRDTVVCQGQPVPFNAGVGLGSQETTVTFESTPFARVGFANHGPTNPYNSAITVNSIFPNTITNLNNQLVSVCIDIETDWLNDLQIALIAPSGQVVTLVANQGGSATAYTNTCFSPVATTPIASGTAPYTGTFRAQGNWNVLNGVPTNGTWRLRVIDTAGPNDYGIIKSWSITFRSTNSVQYTWTPSAGLSCSNCPNPVANPNTTTAYIVQARDNYNCISSDTATLRVIRDAPAPLVTCGIVGDTALTFNWNAAVGISDYEVNILQRGIASGWQGPVGTSFPITGLANNDTVTLQVRAFTGGIDLNCNIQIGQATCAFIVCELDVESISATPADCFGDNNGMASIRVRGGTEPYRYLWNDQLAQISSQAVFLPAGTYRVTVTDVNNCIAVAEATVTQPEQIVISPIVSDARCVGDNNGSIATTITGGVGGGYTFAWNTGATTAQLTNVTAGNYTVTVTDAKGCQRQSTIRVNEPNAPVRVILAQTFRGCNGTRTNSIQATASGGTGNSYTYLWSNGATTLSVTGLDSITYTVTVSDVQGCTAVSNLKLNDLAPIQLNPITSQPTCFGVNDGAIGINIATGGVGTNINDYTFRWNTGQTGAVINNLAAGVTYSVTATDAQGCTGTTSRLLEQPQQVSFDIRANDVRCFGDDNGAATVSNPRGQGNTFSYLWDENAKNQNTATATNLIAGTYRVTVTDARGCTSLATTTIRQPPPIETTFEIKNNLCFGDDKGALKALPKGGVPGYNYAWSNGRTNADATNLTAGTYQVTITDANGCALISNAQVTQPDQLSAKFNVTDVTCFGDRNGRIIVEPIGGTAPYQYSLDNRNFSTSSTFIALKADEYKIYVRDANNCTFLERAEVINPPRFLVDAGERTYTILLGDSLQLTANSTNGVGMVSFVWSAPYAGTLSCSECETVIAKPMEMIIYELYGIDERGCEATDRVTVVVQKIRSVAVPTGFTPNDDGNNDRLLVHGPAGTHVRNFRVYDRWGELLYQQGDFDVNDKSAGWDGTFRNTPASAGVYLWYAEVEYIDGMIEVLKGQTTLIR